ncbi:SpoIIE family protein phosphatase [Rhodobacterales bacterium HKCCSP123]|nr:SpoIIE family protein phosphatase [Rhodobacterales bacterium HKCCSP123]
MLHSPEHLTWPNSYPPPEPQRVLVVDDSRAQRMLLSSLLRRWGHEVVDCGTAEEALVAALDPTVDLVISDWVMPGLTGPEFCRHVRTNRRAGYAYVILLTSKTGDSALSEGLEAGADDFLTKPVRPPELRARLNAGARIVAMQRDLVSKNGLLTGALGELRTLYDALDRDLDEARRLQRAQMQDRARRYGPVDVSLWLKASGHIGGDMVGAFPVEGDTVGVFGLDVSGHGVASAIVAARVAGILSAASPDQNIALTRRADGGFRAVSPDLAAARLNRMILSEMRSDRYFTLALGFLDIPTGILSMVQAGHPHPLVLRADGEIEFAGAGGLPIGLIEGADYERFDVALHPGDRVLVYSDGLIECPGASGGALEEEGLVRLARLAAPHGGLHFLSALEDGLARFAGTANFSDDASAVLITYRGPTDYSPRHAR